MQIKTALIFLASTAGVMGDLHKYGSCWSRFQPINNPNSCPAKTLPRSEDSTPNWNLPLSRFTERGAYGDNEAATVKACAAYRRRNTGNKHWDKCPDCYTGWRRTSDPKYCVNSCNSPAGHMGGDEWNYYCKQAGADGSYAY